eukprot:c17936_g1_i6.p1 GENE.c17936_g1_i6~~c17936_g1_i6.p1  ORF type:complete len:112 (-),score=7.72 c17936_g1_i6:187-522(-)
MTNSRVFQLGRSFFVRSYPIKQLDYGVMFLRGSSVPSSHTAGVDEVCFSPALQQQPHNLHMALVRCDNQWRPSNPLSCVQLCPGLDQQSHHLNVPILGSHMQGCPPILSID